MDQALADIGLGNLTASGVVLLIVLMVLRGTLVTKRQLDEQRQETAYWRTAHGVSEEARRMQAQQMQELLEGNRTIRAVLHALPLPPADPPTGGGAT